MRRARLCPVLRCRSCDPEEDEDSRASARGVNHRRAAAASSGRRWRRLPRAARTRRGFATARRRSPLSRLPWSVGLPPPPPTHNPRPTAHKRHNPQYRPPSGPRARPGYAAVARVTTRRSPRRAARPPAAVQAHAHRLLLHHLLDDRPRHAPRSRLRAWGSKGLAAGERRRQGLLGPGGRDSRCGRLQHGRGRWSSAVGLPSDRRPTPSKHQPTHRDWREQRPARRQL